MLFTSTIAAAVAAFAATSQAAAVRGSSSVVGAAFAMTNAAPQNAIIAFDRLSNGHLTPTGTYWTNGTGLGVDLDIQGGVRLSKDNRFLYAVNAASDEISVFAVTGSKLKLIQTVYGGDEPLSLTINDSNEVLYALSARSQATASPGSRSRTAPSRPSPTPSAV
jgi:6-phosphogluconolactonase